VSPQLRGLEPGPVLSPFWEWFPEVEEARSRSYSRARGAERACLPRGQQAEGSRQWCRGVEERGQAAAQRPRVSGFSGVRPGPLEAAQEASL
jgi:hypothetical protein